MRHSWKRLLLGLSGFAGLLTAGGLPASAPDAHPTPPAAEPNGLVGLYADPEGTQPCIEIRPGRVGPIYVIATNQGSTAKGFCGAEFRIEVSNPEGYDFGFVATSKAAVVLGNPMDLTPADPLEPSGLNIAFAACQTATGSAGDRIPIGTLQVANRAGGATRLWVKRKVPPSNPHFPVPHFNRCDPPKYSIVPMRKASSTDSSEWIVFEALLNDPECAS